MRIRTSLVICAAQHTVCARSGLDWILRSLADGPLCSQSIHVRALAAWSLHQPYHAAALYPIECMDDVVPIKNG
jgi:hypothetical protein